MELPSFIDKDIIYGVGYWILTAGTIIAFLLGFKLADEGFFGVSSMPFFNKIFLIAVTPIVAYLVALSVFNK